MDERIHYFSTTLKGCIFARNIGASKSSGDYLITIDDDVELLDKTILNKFVETLKLDPSIGIVGSIEIRSLSVIIPKGPEILPDEVGRVLPNGDFNTAFGLIEGHGITEVDHVRSAFMGIRNELFRTVGGFDERYNAMGMGFRYESDLCFKVKNLGYKVVVNPEIKVLHKASERQRGFKRNTGFSYFFYANRNHAYFMRKYMWKEKVWKIVINDILVGNQRTPGIKSCLKRFKNEENILWLVRIIPSVLGKLVGNLRFLICGRT
jgi:GT2 family glycosyltransferase